MKQPIITNTEQAKEFYLENIHDCPRGSDLYEAFTPETIKAYERNSSRELERQWCFERFERSYSRITAGNPDNLKLLNDAWEWRDESTPIQTVAEKLEIMMSECGGKPSKTLLDCVISTVMETCIDKSNANEEKLLVRLMELCEPYADDESRMRMRLLIVGPQSEEEAKRQYRMNHFCNVRERMADSFQTFTAERAFSGFATPENTLKWKQEYFDEWTSGEYVLSKDNMNWVNLIDLVVPSYGIYSTENLAKLYNKLADYKNCAADNQYWHIAYEIVNELSKPLFGLGEFDWLKKFYELSADIFDDAPQSWEREYFGNYALEKMEEYLSLIEEKRNG